VPSSMELSVVGFAKSHTLPRGCSLVRLEGQTDAVVKGKRALHSLQLKISSTQAGKTPVGDYPSLTVIE
jgi:hypothetical protein